MNAADGSALRQEINQLVSRRNSNPHGPVNPEHASTISRIRRRLRGLPHSALVQTLQELLDELDVAALAADNSSSYVAANAKATELTGYPHAELLRMTVNDLAPPPKSQFHDAWNHFIQSGHLSSDLVLRRKNGEPVGIHHAAYASIAPGVHLSLLTPLEIPSSI